MKLEPLRDERTSKAAIISDLPAYEGFAYVEPIKGMKVWRNPVNKFTVVQVHYTADKRKDNDDFRARAKAGIPYVQFMREYEIVDCSFEGIPVFMDDFSHEFHVSRSPLVWSKDYPMLRGWDFGLGAEGNACLYAQILPPLRIFCYYEVTSTNVAFERFVDENKRISEEKFGGAFKWIDVCGPEGFARGQTDKRANTDVIRTVMKTSPIPGAKGVVERCQAVSKFLKRNVKGLPALLIDGAGCTILKDGFTGGYHFAYKQGGRLHETPAKNEYSNVHDALQAICSRANTLENGGRATITFHQPSYGTGRAA